MQPQKMQVSDQYKRIVNIIEVGMCVDCREVGMMCVDIT
jgi:hypothetical protein